MSDTGQVISDEVKAASAAREARVLAEPPRILPLRPEEFTPEVQKICDDLRVAAGIPPSTHVPEVVATSLKHPRLYLASLDFSMQMMGTGLLPARDRELLILRTGWILQAPFEWAEHVAAAYRKTDLTAHEIDRVTYGSSAEGWSRHEAALLSAVEDLFADAMIGDETWATLAERYDEKQLMELCMLVGHYAGTAFLQNSIRARLEPNSKGLFAR